MNDFNELSDEKLVSLYLKGNNNAFDVLLNRYKSKVFQYIFYSVKKQELAEDLFQDVFVKVVMTLRDGRYKENGKFAPWIMRIAHNLIIDHHRHNNNGIKIVSNDDDTNYISDRNIAINENRELELIEQQTLSDAEFLVTLLPRYQREVLCMRIYENLSFKEIAEKTGVSINTALGRMHYAIQSLRKLAAEYGMTA
ncbi:MAG: sigma-70 family RNA polymerase sigma factor [Bacteroidaceae bacterium]|nr:sigma-70 family RNA polymerase sigma factor [Bacteroidaceae bacterium]